MTVRPSELYTPRYPFRLYGSPARMLGVACSLGLLSLGIVGCAAVHPKVETGGAATSSSRLHPTGFFAGWFVSPSTGRFVFHDGSRAVLSATSDAGQHWSPQLQLPCPHLWQRDMSFVDAKHGFVVDEFTRVALVCRVDTSIGTRAVIEELAPAFEANGKPKIIRSDNGREFIATTLKNWLAERGVTIAYIEKGQPQQNCFVERYRGSMRNEVLANEDFDTVLEARIIVQQWAFEEYNTRRPHRAHGMLTPRQFADGWKVGRR